MKIIKEEDPDFIGLQEVTPSIVAYFKEHPFIQSHYYMTDDNGKTCVPYGCLLLSKIKPTVFEMHQFPTGQNRSLIMGRFVVNGKRFTVGTVHLESYPHQGPERKAQLEISFEGLEKDSESSILMGDFNFGDGRENERIPSNWKDTWREIYEPVPTLEFIVEEEPSEHTINGKGFTFDPKRVRNNTFDLYQI